MARSVAYLKARFDERSTWAAISAGIIGASALAEPWSYVAAAVGVLGAVIPTSGGSDA
ncbi:hypothetical protein [Novosphingobium chloroacetimidivorans]|uniref:hypothetical protein n=1 Tax=Novosphingobium chloroacetimidivorans TaxID=1428314 RepID=UPI001C8804EF|nr:hypothetical protein [Novosphingobium chloroacetimidivorans]